MRRLIERKSIYLRSCAYSSIVLRFSLLNSGTSTTDDGRNISVGMGAVCALCNRFGGKFSMFLLFTDENSCPKDCPLFVGRKIFGMC